MAIATNACQNLRRVRFFGVVELVNKLESEKSAARQGALAQRLAKMDAIVLDLCEALSYVELGGL